MAPRSWPLLMALTVVLAGCGPAALPGPATTGAPAAAVPIGSQTTPTSGPSAEPDGTASAAPSTVDGPTGATTALGGAVTAYSPGGGTP